MHETSAIYTPRQNGLAERKNRTLVVMVNAMILNAKVPFNMWGEAFLCACHIHNHTRSSKFKVSPYIPCIALGRIYLFQYINYESIQIILVLSIRK